jgi:5'-nucleotidase (lipoprotein e(P4) family)
MTHGWRLLCIVLCVSTGASACAAKRTPQPATVTPPATVSRDAHENLHAVLWMQTSAEYRMLAESIYAQAVRALDAALADRTWTAATEQSGDFALLPPAVILDIDETVIDNLPAQGQQILDRVPYAAGLFDRWVTMQRAGAVPGAVAFLKHAAGRGVAIYYVTNRRSDHDAATAANLQALGVAANPDIVLSVGEQGWTSTDKTARRAFVSKTHRVLLLVGDDLNDFIRVQPSGAEVVPEDRVRAAEAHRERWGTRWFLLPNPMYGSWERSLSPASIRNDDAKVLERKRALTKGLPPATESRRE